MPITSSKVQKDNIGAFVPYTLTLYLTTKFEEGILKPKKGEHKVVTILKKTANTLTTPLFALVSLVETSIRIPFVLIAFGLSKVLPKAFNDNVGEPFKHSGILSTGTTALLGIKTVTNVIGFKKKQPTTLQIFNRLELIIFNNRIWS